MVKTVRKGYRLERLAESHLQNQGYQTHRAAKSGFTIHGKYFTRSNDIFGCIDIIAISPTNRTRFIQVTSGTVSKSTKFKKLAEVDWNLGYSNVELWMYIGRGKWEIYRLTGVKEEYELIKYALIEKGREFISINQGKKISV